MYVQVTPEQRPAQPEYGVVIPVIRQPEPLQKSVTTLTIIVMELQMKTLHRQQHVVRANEQATPEQRPVQPEHGVVIPVILLEEPLQKSVTTLTITVMDLQMKT